MTVDESILLTLVTQAAELIEIRAADRPTKAEEIWLELYNAYMDKDDDQPTNQINT